MMQVSLSPPTRHPCDPRTPGVSLWCGEDVALECDYVEPENLEQAVDALRTASGRARIVAGGQSLLPALRSGMMDAGRLVSLRRIASLKTIACERGMTVIGAEVTFAEFLASAHAAAQPLLKQAVSHVGHHTVRNRTTFGGTIAWANPMGALLLALAMLDATVVTTQRRLASTDCVTGALRNSLAGDEVIVAVEIPMAPATRRFAFHKTTARRSGGKALASMAAILDVDHDGSRSLRIGAVGLLDRAWVSPWRAYALGESTADPVNDLLASAPVPSRFDPLLPSPYYARASTSLVCRRLVQEMLHE